MENEKVQAFLKALSTHFLAQKALISAAKELGQAYYTTQHWHDLRKAKLKQKRHTCEVCGAKKGLQVHHLTYEFFGCERMKELKVLCRKCHMKTHYIYKADDPAHVPVTPRPGKKKKQKFEIPKTITDTNTIRPKPKE